MAIIGPADVPLIVTLNNPAWKMYYTHLLAATWKATRRNLNAVPHGSHYAAVPESDGNAYHVLMDHQTRPPFDCIEVSPIAGFLLAGLIAIHGRERLELSVSLGGVVLSNSLLMPDEDAASVPEREAPEATE